MIALAVETASAPAVATALLWTALPYVSLAVLVVGLVWRYRYDRFGWSTRSSQMYETRIMRIASPLFHYGIIAVFFGHMLGLLVPEQWTEALGIDEHAYHSATMPMSILAGTATAIGFVALIVRRRTSASIMTRTTRGDKAMYVFLGSAIALGIAASWFASGLLGEGHNYREDVSVWLRSILLFSPQPDTMAGAPLIFQLHVAAGFVMFAVWPFTRLVHALSAPVQYLARPYVIYRTRTPHRTGARAPRPGWEPSRRD